jgi:hypothetical protein
MGRAFFGRFVYAGSPAPEEDGPQGHCARDNQQAKAPKTVSSMRVDSADSEESKRQREQEATEQIGSEKNK